MVLWGIYDVSHQTAPSCHLIYLEEEKKKELLLVPKRGNNTRYMNIYDEHTRSLKGEGVSCPGEALRAFGSLLPCSRASRQYPEGVPALLLLPALQPETPTLASC